MSRARVLIVLLTLGFVASSCGDDKTAAPSVELPTLVIHGRDDTLIQPSGGIRTAELIPNATLLLLADMGHDMPEPLWPMIVGTIAAHTKLAG